MSARTTTEFKRIPVGKVCTVYFFAIDVVLGRTPVRQAWQSRCHYPKILFHPKKGRKGKRTATRLQNYPYVKRMIGVKNAVFKHHRNMLRLYEKFCVDAECEAYWGDDEDGDVMEMEDAEEHHEDDCDDEF